MSDCIEWTGARTGAGYGSRHVGGRRVATHRLAWIEAYGPIPDGLCVLHRCDNRPCMNVDHLFLGTRLDNMRDMVAKGRLPRRVGALSSTARLTQAQVDAIRELYAAGGISKSDIGRQFGISNSHAGRVISGRCWPITTNP